MLALKTLVNIILFVVYLVFFYNTASWMLMYAYSLGMALPGALLSFIVAVLVFTTFHFLHFNPYKDLSPADSNRKKTRIAGVLSLLFMGVFGLFFFFSKASVWLYEANQCTGGLGSGVSCPTGPSDLIASLVATNTILAFMGFGALLMVLFYIGCFFACRWVWLKRQAPVLGV